MRTYIHTYILTYIHTYACAYTYIYIYFYGPRHSTAVDGRSGSHTAHRHLHERLPQQQQPHLCGTLKRPVRWRRRRRPRSENVTTPRLQYCSPPVSRLSVISRYSATLPSHSYTSCWAHLHIMLGTCEPRKHSRVTLLLRFIISHGFPIACATQRRAGTVRTGKDRQMSVALRDTIILTGRREKT